MNIVYSSDFGDITIGTADKAHLSAQATRLMHYAILLRQFFGAKDMPREHTTSTEGFDLQKMMRESDEFRKIMSSGLYAKAGDHLCLYTPSLIKSGKDSNTLEINEDVQKKPEECCLTIAADSIDEVKETNDYSKVSFFHPEKSEELQHTGVISENFNLSLWGVVPGSFDESDGINASTLADNPLEYHIKEHAKLKGISLKRLADEIMVSERTIERFWRKPKSRPALNNVIAVCIGLEMPPPTSDLIIELAGYKLRNIPLERAYRSLINGFSDKGIAVCNQILRENNLEALTAAT